MQGLPAFMVPSVWVVVDGFAFNSAGSWIVRRCQLPDFTSVVGDYVAPSSEGGRWCCWGLVGLERVSRWWSRFLRWVGFDFVDQLVSAAKAAGLNVVAAGGV